MSQGCHRRCHRRHRHVTSHRRVTGEHCPQLLFVLISGSSGSGSNLQNNFRLSQFPPCSFFRYIPNINKHSLVQPCFKNTGFLEVCRKSMKQPRTSGLGCTSPRHSIGHFLWGEPKYVRYRRYRTEEEHAESRGHPHIQQRHLVMQLLQSLLAVEMARPIACCNPKHIYI